MTPYEIQMCVADVLQDDDLENVDSIVKMLNHEYDSWRTARGSLFTTTEVLLALEQLIAQGLVAPCVEQAPFDACRPLPASQPTTPLETLWFHLEAAGREAVREWWESEGHIKYPLAPD